MIIAIDFDGTIVENRFPEIGRTLPNAIKTLKLLQAEGHTLILHTCRHGIELQQAIAFCHSWDIIFDAVNCNIECKLSRDAHGTLIDTRKIYADIYIDDKAIGIPTDDAFRPDWNKIYDLIQDKTKVTFEMEE